MQGKDDFAFRDAPAGFLWEIALSGGRARIFWMVSVVLADSSLDALLPLFLGLAIDGFVRSGVPHWTTMLAWMGVVIVGRVLFRVYDHLQVKHMADWRAPS